MSIRLQSACSRPSRTESPRTCTSINQYRFLTTIGEDVKGMRVIGKQCHKRQAFAATGSTGGKRISPIRNTHIRRFSSSWSYSSVFSKSSGFSSAETYIWFLSLLTASALRLHKQRVSRKSTDCHTVRRVPDHTTSSEAFPMAWIQCRLFDDHNSCL